MSALPQGNCPLITYSAAELALYDKGPLIREFIKLGLTRRQSEIMSLLLDGKKNNEIASDLCVSNKTIRFHLTSVYRTLKVKNKHQAIVRSHQLIKLK